jgi:hypothetical protein
VGAAGKAAIVHSISLAWLAVPRYLSLMRRPTMQKRVNPGGMLPRVVRVGIVAMLVPLLGCVTAYELENPTGGYSDFRVEENAYRVRFKGNNYTSRKRVEDFLLYRCAELTDKLGYDHFLMVGADTLDISDLFAQSGAAPRNYYATALIKVFQQPDNPAAQNAKQVMLRLEEEYPDELGWGASRNGL